MKLRTQREKPVGKELATKSVAFNYGGVDVLFDDDRLVSLTSMWKAEGSPKNKAPKDWLATDQGKGFVDHLAQNLNVATNHIWKGRRGKHLGGTWSHWQIALAYAKYLSHEFHRQANEALREFAREAADPGLKAERAIAGYERQGYDHEWIERRFSGIVNRKALTGTMRDHNAKQIGNDNPYAEGTRSIYLSVIGKTPKEIKAGKGLAKSARTRDHLSTEELISIEWAEIQARKLMVNEAADGNAECVDACRRAGRAVKLALASLASPA